ncbi:MAG: cation-translocating P-type ATPase [Patescibacteria group bacterium]
MYHTKSFEDTIKNLSSSPQGLTQTDAENRIKTFGYNELPEPIKEPLILKFLDQFKNLLVLLLISATVISFFLGERLDAIAILAIVIVNAILGFVQEFKAEKAIEALKRMSASYCKVIRGTEVSKIEARHLVPGDIILVEAGDKIPADARLIEAINLEVSEAVLTGESVPVKKITDLLENENLSLGDRKNILFKDTSVSYGRGKAIVVATGIQTEVGKISTLLTEEKVQETPLQKELGKVGKNLSFAALIIIVVIFGVEIFVDGEGIKEAFLTSVSLAVAAIPEGLPAVITVVLAIGVTRLAKKKAIIRKLPAVETLGATTHILTDKTGTLTQNRMMVTKILSGNTEFSVDGEGYAPKGSFYDSSLTKVNATEFIGLTKLLAHASLCNNAVLKQNEGGKWEIIGDITEGALLVCAEKAGIRAKELMAQKKRVFEIPFSSEDKFMMTAHENGDGIELVVKGAPEVVLSFCSMEQDKKQKIEEKIKDFAGSGLRNLGVTFKEVARKDFDNTDNKRTLLTGMIFEGLIAQKDPLRLEVKDAVKEAQAAGVTTIMVTGDHKLMAVSIAKELGMISSEDEAISGEEMVGMKEAQIDQLIKAKRVYARVSPEQKLILVKAYKRAGYIVTVTGDGVNDAPALKAGNIGVAMGIEGTDVAKEASSMILQNDNFATIVAAIKEGRIIFDNLIKFITYLISCNISEIMIIFVAAILRDPVPLLPIHLLWINFITDGFPALALGMEPGEKDIMQRKPRETKNGILNKERWLFMTLEGIFMGALAYIVFNITLRDFGLAEARTATFLTLSILQLIHAFNSRSENQSLLKVGITENKFLFLIVVFSIIAQVPVLYTSFGEKVFGAEPLGLFEYVPIALTACLFFLFVEVLKKVKRLRI